MILFLYRNNEKWPHTRQIKIAGRNHILPPLGIAWKTKQTIPKRELKLNVKLSKISSTLNRCLSETIRTSIIALDMVQLTTEQRTFIIKTFYETSTLQQACVAFGLINFA